MNISPNISSVSYIDPFPAINSSKISQTKATSTNEAMDIVNISQEAKELSSNNLPVEAFSLPDWLSEYIPKESIVSGELGSNNLQTNSNNPKLGLYNDKLLSFLREELQNIGIENSVDYYQSFLNNNELNEQVHQAVRNRMLEDDQFTELANSFNIKI